MPSACACSSRPAISSSTWRAAARRGRCQRAAALIASFKAFENAMTLDIAMGGSTNTVLHLLAAAYEAEIDFTMADIDRPSRRVPVLCKVAPSNRRAPRGRLSRRRDHGHPRRARPRSPPQPRRDDGPRFVARARAVAPRRQARREPATRDSSPPRRAARRRRRRSARLRATRRSTRTAPAVPCATPSTRPRTTAALRCSRTSPRTAPS